MAERNAVRLLLAFGLVLSTEAWAQTKEMELAYAEWQVKAPHSVLADSFSKDSVARFNSLLDLSYPKRLSRGVREAALADLAQERVDERSKVPGALGDVGDFRWVDVDADGVYELLFIMDASGRRFYNNLGVVKKTGSTFWFQEISVWNAPEITESPATLQESYSGKVIVSDIDSDGLMELIAPILIGPYRGAAAAPVWTGVFKWGSGMFEEADLQFRSFYEEILLPRIERSIAELSEGKDVAHQDSDQELGLEWVLRDRIQRLFRRDSQAGLERAIRWAASPDPVIRQNALAELGDIPGPESARILKELSGDKNVTIAGEAKRLLSKRG